MNIVNVGLSWVDYFSVLSTAASACFIVFKACRADATEPAEPRKERLISVSMHQGEGLGQYAEENFMVAEMEDSETDDLDAIDVWQSSGYVQPMSQASLN